MDYLYRYISFETFVGMVQSQALTFVLPSTWDDPYEVWGVSELLSRIDNTNVSIALAASIKKSYAQCWTELAESDAMWRIYAYGNKAIRLKVSYEKLKALEGVDIVPVRYTDSSELIANEGEDPVLKALSQKRTAFEHEKEVRLIKRYKFVDDNDVMQHYYAMLIALEHPRRVEIIERHFRDMPLEEAVNKVSELVNEGKKRRVVQNVSYATIPDFISGVLVHPQAPSWYVEIVKQFCENNNIPFEGKSALYSDAFQ